METEEFAYLFKYVIIGESGVGKSCIVLNFSEQNPRKHHQVTIACEFASRTVRVKGKDIKIQIWDTAGQENFRSLTRSYYRSSIASLVVYDITNRQSFDKLASWIEELRENCQKETVIAVVGNKKDCERQRQVTFQEGLNFAKKYGFQFTETCAFEKDTVEPLFIGIAENILEKIQNGEIDPTNERIGIKVGNKGDSAMKISRNKGGQAETKKGGCC